jgi:molybdenum cofactor cytidylyltransferase
VKINGLILTAGLSSRMGNFKPLMQLEGKTMIENSIDSMLDAGVDCVTVVLGYRADDVASLIESRYKNTMVRLAYNTEYDKTDMLASVKIGIRSLPACDAFFLLPGDMPAVDRKTFCSLSAVMQKTNALVVFPTIDGHRKHPPLISGAFTENILAFEGEGGLQAIWRQYDKDMASVPVEDTGCRIDADTMEDYSRLVQYMQNRKKENDPAPVQKQQDGGSSI